MSDVAHWPLVLSYSETAQQNFMKLSSSEGHVVYRYMRICRKFFFAFFSLVVMPLLKLEKYTAETAQQNFK